jgi:hypothetical protein
MPRDSWAQGNFGGLTIGPTGCLWGAEDDNNWGVTPTIETKLNRNMAIRNKHYDWNAGSPQAYPTAFETAAKADRVIPMVSQEGAGNFPVKRLGQGSTNNQTVNGAQGIDRITNGEWDAMWRARATAMKNLNYPIIFRLFMEMDGAHNPYNASWQYGAGQTVTNGAAAFANAWRHVWNIFNSLGATLAAGGNVIFCWCTQANSHTPSDYRLYYPGAQYVDWHGVDVYRDAIACGMAGATAGSNDMYAFANTHSKPIGVFEAGFQQWTSGKSGFPYIISCGGTTYDKDGSGTGRSLILHTRDEIKNTYPNIIAYVHWNHASGVTFGWGTANDAIDTSAKSLADYRAWTSDPYFAAMPNVSGTTPPPTSVGPTTTAAPTTAPPTTTRPPATTAPPSTAPPTTPSPASLVWHTRKAADYGAGFAPVAAIDKLNSSRIGIGGDTWGGPYVSEDGGGMFQGRKWGLSGAVKGYGRGIRFSERPAVSGMLYYSAGSYSGGGGGFFSNPKSSLQVTQIGTQVAGSLLGDATIMPRAVNDLLDVEYDSATDTEYIYFTTTQGLFRAVNNTGSGNVPGSVTQLAASTVTPNAQQGWAVCHVIAPGTLLVADYADPSLSPIPAIRVWIVTNARATAVATDVSSHAPGEVFGCEVNAAGEIFVACG